MSQIPAQVSPEQFQHYIWPYLSKAKRRLVSRIPLYSYSTQVISIILKIKI